MNRECPVCHHQAPFDSPYCPACGAPMQKASEEGRPSQGEAIIRQVSQAQKSISPLPMKWHSFLKFVSIPFSFVLAAVNLIQEIKELSAFNAANYYPQAAEAVRLSLQVGIAVNAALLAVLTLIEIGLVRMRWQGVRLLLGNYLFQALYGVWQLILFRPLIASVAVDLTNVYIALAQMLLLFVLNLIYYRKRRALFQPQKINSSEN